jgi:lysophospholipase L1-like esterase
MAASKVHNWSMQHDLSVHQQCQYDIGCVDCQKLKNELNEVRTELKSVKEIVNLLNQDLASFSKHEHNLNGEESPWITDDQWEKQHPRRSSKKNSNESTACKSCFITNSRYQVLDNFQVSDSIGVAPNGVPHTGKDHRNIIKTRSSQAPKVISSTSSGNTDSHETEINNHRPIPVIVNGQAPTSMSPPAKRHKKDATLKKDQKMLIIGDSHTRLWTQNVKSYIKENFHVQGLVKPGAGVDIIVTTANSDITSLTKNDVVIVCGGANDVAKNNAKMALIHISNFVKANNHTNIIVTNLPHRFDLIQYSCVNSEIRSFNRKLMKSLKPFNHVSILEMCSERKFFTNHGLHLNGLGREVMAKKIVSHTCTLLNQKKNPPIVLSWSSENTSTDTQLGRVVNIMPTITKETSAKTPNACLCNEDYVLPGDNIWTNGIGITVQDGISKVAEEIMEDTVTVHQAQLNPTRSQKATNEIEELTTHHLEQKKTRCKVSSRLKKPPVTKSDYFLY